MYRIRSWVSGTPLPNMDVKTGSWPMALREAREKAARYGSWDDVSLIVPGERPFKGEDLRRVCERAAQ